MKILIVDDATSKVRKLIELFIRLGVPRQSIDVATNATSARGLVTQNVYDILILDLLLPLREETDPKCEVSIEFLREVTERDIYLKPKRFVGFTAHVGLIEDALPHFEDWLWTVVHYDETTDEWQHLFENLIKYINKCTNGHQPQEYQTDLCVITALHAPELQAVHGLPWNWQPSLPIDDTTFVRTGSFKSKDENYTVVSASAPRMGCVASALLSTKLIEHFRPRFLVMTGICAGVRGKVNLGDVVLFAPTWEWASGKIVPEDESSSYLEPSPHQIPTADFILARMEEFKKDHVSWAEIQAGWPGTVDHSLKIVLAPGASGSAVIADNLTLNEILKQNRKLTAVDMEAYGVAAASSSMNVPKPTTFILKSVCDFADDTKADTWQTYAAYTSAKAMQLFFEKYMSEVKALAGT